MTAVWQRNVLRTLDALTASVTRIVDFVNLWQQQLQEVTARQTLPGHSITRLLMVVACSRVMLLLPGSWRWNRKWVHGTLAVNQNGFTTPAL